MRFILLLIVALFYACSNEPSSETEVFVTDSDIVGSWLLTGTKTSIGGPLPEEFSDTNFFEEFSFAADGKYRLKRESTTKVISEGKFTTTENELFLSPDSESIGNELSYLFWFEDGSLILSPSGPVLCIEGCLYRYEKTD